MLRLTRWEKLIRYKRWKNWFCYKFIHTWLKIIIIKMIIKSLYLNYTTSCKPTTKFLINNHNFIFDSQLVSREIFERLAEPAALSRRMSRQSDLASIKHFLITFPYIQLTSWKAAQKNIFRWKYPRYEIDRVLCRSSEESLNILVSQF